MNIDGNNLEIVIERKRIKNIYFRINENNQIYVTCPYILPEFEIKRVLKKNEDALIKMYRKVQKRNLESNKILFLGNEIDFVEHKKIIITSDRIYGPSIKTINEYLEKNSLKYFEKRLALYINEFNGIPKFRLRVRKMKTRWGVCNRKSMTITLNTLLIHKRDFLIDYVIVHELSHFRHMDHSLAFWNEVQLHYPKYKEARKELKD